MGEMCYAGHIHSLRSSSSKRSGSNPIMTSSPITNVGVERL